MREPLKKWGFSVLAKKLEIYDCREQVGSSSPNQDSLRLSLEPGSAPA